MSVPSRWPAAAALLLVKTYSLNDPGSTDKGSTVAPDGRPSFISFGGAILKFLKLVGVSLLLGFMTEIFTNFIEYPITNEIAGLAVDVLFFAIIVVLTYFLTKRIMNRWYALLMPFIAWISAFIVMSVWTSFYPSGDDNLGLGMSEFMNQMILFVGAFLGCVIPALKNVD